MSKVLTGMATGDNVYRAIHPVAGAAVNTMPVRVVDNISEVVLYRG